MARNKNGSWEQAYKEYFALREKVLAPAFFPVAGSADEGLIHVLRSARELSEIPIVGAYCKPMVMKHIEMAQKIERYCAGSNSLHFSPPFIKALEIDEVEDMIATLNHQETAFERAQRLEEIDKVRQMVKHRLKCEKNRKKRKKKGKE